jgi:hypothetical protein
MTPTWRSAWQGQDIVIHRDAGEFARLDGRRIERIVSAHPNDSGCAVDLRFALVFLHDHAWLLPAFTGIAGPVHFERQDWWAAHGGLWWVDPTAARLPGALIARPRPWERAVARPVRLGLPEADALSAAWPLEGPMTWTERRWARIERRRPFGAANTAPALLRA